MSKERFYKPKYAPKADGNDSNTPEEEIINEDAESNKEPEIEEESAEITENGGENTESDIEDGAEDDEIVSDAEGAEENEAAENRPEDEDGSDGGNENVGDNDSDDEDIELFAERINGARHSHVVTAAPIRVRQAEASKNIVELSAEATQKNTHGKKLFTGIVSAVAALAILLVGIIAAYNIISPHESADEGKQSSDADTDVIQTDDDSVTDESVTDASVTDASDTDAEENADVSAVTEENTGDSDGQDDETDTSVTSDGDTDEDESASSAEETTTAETSGGTENAVTDDTLAVQPEAQQPETQQQEAQQQEAQQQEAQQTESQQSWTQQSETQQSETQQTESQQSWTQQSETQQSETQQQEETYWEENYVEPEPEPEPVVQKYWVHVAFYDRDAIDVYTEPDMLFNILAQYGIYLTENEVPTFDQYTTINEDMSIWVDKYEYSTVTVSEDVPYESIVHEIDTIPRGEVNYISSGENGVRNATYVVEYKNGEEISRTLSYEEVTKYPVSEEYEIGVGGTLVGNDGVTYSYSYRRTVPATYYNLEGLTYLGTYADESVIATDMDYIPMGTKLYVKNDRYDFGVRTASDIGGQVDNWEIDIWLSDSNPYLEAFRQEGYIYDMEIYYLD